jgi:hypothetical protein
MSRTPAETSTLTNVAAPRHGGWIAAAVYAVATLVLGYPALGGRFLVSVISDQFKAGYAFREFAAESLRSGQGFPQWNPYLFGGLPYVGGMHGDIFYPTFLLRMILPTDVAMTWGMIIHVFLAGLFTYFFLRAYGIGFYGALIGGLAYCISGPIGGLVAPGHDGKIFISALLPLALWMLVLMIRRGRHWSYGAFAAVVGLGVLTPHPQLFQYLLLATGAFALFLALSADADGRKLERSVALERLIFAFGAVVLGGLLGAIQFTSLLGGTFLKALFAALALFGATLVGHTAIFRTAVGNQGLRYGAGAALLVTGAVTIALLPALVAYQAWSPRSADMGWDHAVSYSMPAEELLNAVIPEFTGMLGNYWGRNLIHFHSEYVGVVTLVLAGLGMFSALVPRRVRWFWLGVLIISLLWALGSSTPFYRLVYAIVPGTESFRAPSTMMFVTMFAAAVFAAFGTERMLRGAETITRRYIVGWAVAIVAFGLIAIPLAGAVAGMVGEYLATYTGNRAYADAWPDRARGNQSALAIGAVRSIVFVLITLGVLWARQMQRVPARTAAVALATLIAIDLWIVEKHYWRFSSPAAELYAADPAVAAIRADSTPGRVLALDVMKESQDGDAFYGSERRGLPNGTGLMVHGIRSVTGYHGNELARYQAIDTLITNPVFWRHENVEYLYTTLPDSMIGQALPGAQKVVGPVKNAAGSTVYLYRLPGDNAMAWVATTMVKGTDEQAFATVFDPRFDPRRAAVIDTAAPVSPAPLSGIPEPSTVQARVTRYEPGHIEVQLSQPVAAGGTVLVVSENYYPGWGANIGGQAAAVIRANFNLIGVPLPQGAREITLTFRDAAYQLGKVVTLSALVATVLAVILGILWDRRQSRVAV